MKPPLLIFIIITIIEVASSYKLRKPLHKVQNDDNCGFRCNSGSCISQDNECDGRVDCDDGSDETTNCLRLKCPTFLFRCTYGACVNPDSKCDGKRDCRDSSDEDFRNCGDNFCSAGEFPCKSRNGCVAEEQKCDGKAQCADYSDENRELCGNMNCPAYLFRCSYGACIDGDLKCDGKADCHDGSDEFPNICANTTNNNYHNKPQNSSINVNIFIIFPKD